jgi:hypothetical protein
VIVKILPAKLAPVICLVDKEKIHRLLELEAVAEAVFGLSMCGDLRGDF